MESRLSQFPADSAGMACLSVSRSSASLFRKHRCSRSLMHMSRRRIGTPGDRGYEMRAAFIAPEIARVRLRGTYVLFPSAELFRQNCSATLSDPDLRELVRTQQF